LTIPSAWNILIPCKTNVTLSVGELFFLRVVWIRPRESVIYIRQLDGGNARRVWRGGGNDLCQGLAGIQTTRLLKHTILKDKKSVKFVCNVVEKKFVKRMEEW